MAEHVPDLAKEFFADMPEGIRDLASLGIGYGAGFMANKLGGAVVKPFKMLDKTNTAALLLEEHALAERVLSEKILESHTKKPNMAIAEVIEDKTGITWENKRKEIEKIKDTRQVKINPPLKPEDHLIGNRYYSEHALKRMYQRDIKPMAVENAIEYGMKLPGNTINEVAYYNPESKLKVVLNNNGDVVSLFKQTQLPVGMIRKK